MDEAFRQLGVRPGADAEEIRRAFAWQVARFHPATHPDMAYAIRMTRLLIDAFETACARSTAGTRVGPKPT